MKFLCNTPFPRVSVFYDNFDKIPRGVPSLPAVVVPDVQKSQVPKGILNSHDISEDTSSLETLCNVKEIYMCIANKILLRNIRVTLRRNIRVTGNGNPAQCK